MTRKLGFLLILFALCFVFSMSTPAKAADIQLIQSGQKVENNLEDTERVFYEIHVKKSSYLEVQVTSYSRDLEITLTDDARKYIASANDEFRNATATAPITHSFGEYLEPGVYRVEAFSHGYMGEKLKHHFTVTEHDSKLTEKEPNNIVEQAMDIAPTQKPIKAQVSRNDYNDYYKVKLTKQGELTFKVQANFEQLHVRLHDEKMKEIRALEVYLGGTKDNPKADQQSVHLNKGTYYVVVSKAYGDFTGRYELETKFTERKTTEKEPNNKVSQAQKLLLGKQTVTGLITWNDRIDYYRVDVPKASALKVDFTAHDSMAVALYNQKQKFLTDLRVYKSPFDTSTNFKQNLVTYVNVPKGTYYIKVFDHRDGTGIYKLSTGTKPTIKMNPPKAKATKTAVTGKTYPYSEVIIKIGNKTYKKMSDLKGNFNIKIPKQKINTVIQIAVSNETGKSPYAKIKVS